MSISSLSQGTSPMHIQDDSSDAPRGQRAPKKSAPKPALNKNQSSLNHHERDLIARQKTLLNDYTPDKYNEMLREDKRKNKSKKERTAIPNALLEISSPEPTVPRDVYNSRHGGKHLNQEEDAVAWNHQATKLYMDLQFDKQMIRDDKQRKRDKDKASESQDENCPNVKRNQSISKYHDSKGRPRRQRTAVAGDIILPGDQSRARTPADPLPRSASQVRRETKKVDRPSRSERKEAKARGIPRGFRSEEDLVYQGGKGGPETWPDEMLRGDSSTLLAPASSVVAASSVMGAASVVTPPAPRRARSKRSTKPRILKADSEDSDFLVVRIHKSQVKSLWDKDSPKDDCTVQGIRVPASEYDQTIVPTVDANTTTTTSTVDYMRDAMSERKKIIDEKQRITVS